MNPNRRTALIVGVLFLISYFGVFAGAALVEPVMNSTDPASIVSKQIQVVGGALLEVLNGAAVLAIAVLMFPLLKPYNEAVALGYVGMRILEAAMQVAMDFSPLTLLNLSRAHVQTGIPDAVVFQSTNALLVAERQSASTMLLVFFALGALLFYVLLYRSRLVPRFISVWGFAAVALVVLGNLFEFSLAVSMIFALPIIANELFLAVWLIAKGFDSAAIAAEYANLSNTEGDQ